VIAFGVVILAAGVFTVLPARFLLYWVIGAFTVLLMDTRGKTGLGVLGAIILACGVVLRQLALKSVSVAPVILVPDAMAEMLVCGGFYLMLPLLCSERMNIALGFLRKPAAALAGISFTLYLAHAPINALNDLFLPRAANISVLSLIYFVLRCAICLGAAIVLYWLFERNTTTVRSYFKARTTRARERSAADRSGSAKVGGHIAPRLR
jgi:peptidoglycan/LPS O-acetylase OafA/YrhL